MASIETSIEIELPIRTVYNQWTQFEEFPLFMEGITSVTQLDDATLHWVAEIGGQVREWTATITDQVPDDRVVWRSDAGAVHAGIVTFDALDPARTLVTLRLDFEPSGFAEKVGDVLGIVQRRTEGDLERFKEFIEARGRETGGWRGEIRRTG